MFAKRLISGIVLLLIAFVLLYQGGAILFFASLGISLIGVFELYRVLKIEKELPAFIGYLGIVVYYGCLWFHLEDYLILFSIITLMCMLAVYVFTFPRYQTEQITSAYFGIFYVAVMFSYLFILREHQDGQILVWLIFTSSWGCDTSAYCAGKLFGKHKLAPVLSPKKTVEGAVGGVAGSALLGLLVGLFARDHMTMANPLMICTLSSAIAAVISQIGDLAASAIKRNHDIKDYGNLIPGHGGILDRFDSMLFTAPAIYFAVMFLQ